VTAADFSALLDVLIRKAQLLRSTGVLAFELGDFKVQMMPPDQTGPEMAKASHQSGDPFKDPATYGLGPGEPLPGYEIERDSDL